MLTEIQTRTVRLRERGQLTIPHDLREKLMAAGGEVLTLLQIGDLLLLTPRQPRVSRLSEQFTAEMDKAGVSLADLLVGLAEERQTSYQEQKSPNA